jgi:hypothetical protein
MCPDSTYPSYQYHRSFTPQCKNQTCFNNVILYSNRLKGSYINHTKKNDLISNLHIKSGMQSSNIMRQIQLTQITPPRAPNHLASAAEIPTEKFIQSLGAQLPQPPKSSDWHTGLVACCTDSDTCTFCLLACPCPCIAYGMNYSLLIGKDSCDVRTCCCPCLLFAALEAVGITATAAAATDKRNLSGGGSDLAGLFQFCMLYQHRYAVGKSAGIYSSNEACTHWAICCELTWCAPCAQAQLRSEVRFQRNTIGHNFTFTPQRNVCCCKMCCCEKDCGCAGCVTTD